MKPRFVEVLAMLDEMSAQVQHGRALYRIAMLRTTDAGLDAVAARGECDRLTVIC
jgi:hypothetical protein